MTNNIQDLFTKYKTKINSKKEKESIIIEIIKEKTGVVLNKKNIKIDILNKKISFINLNSSLRFLLKNKLNNILLEEIQNKTNFTLEI